jgi:hypothetical protein
MPMASPESREEISGIKANENVVFDNSICSMFFNKRDGAGFAAQGRQQAAGSGETEGTNGL